MKRYMVSLVLCAGLLAGGCSSKPHEKLCSMELLSDQNPVKVVSVMPADVTIQRETVKGEDEIYEMSEDVALLMEKAAGKAFSKFDFEVADNGLGEDFEEDPDLKFELNKLHGKCADISIQTEPDFTKPEEIRITDTRIQNGELKIGYEAAQFGEYCGADAILLIEAFGVVHSAGKQALGAVAALGGVTIIYYDQVIYRASLVDTNDGTVLMMLYGGASLDQFITKDALPGTEKYEQGMETLEQALEISFTRKLAQTLEREPKEQEQEE